MEKAIIGRKIGMSQIFDEAGKVIPVTVIEAGPCVVVQKKTVEKDGYNAVQLGFQDVAERKLTKPEQGHLKKAEVPMKKVLKEFKLDKAAEMNVGDEIKADTFAKGDHIDVTGISKGKGYQGVVKRWNAARLKESHGTGPVHRHAGSMGSGTDPSRIFKGKIGAGQMGNEQITVPEVHGEDHPREEGRRRHQRQPAEGFCPCQPAEGFRQKPVRKGEFEQCLKRIFIIWPASRSARWNSPRAFSA